MNQKDLTQRTVKAIRAARTQDECDDATLEFLCGNAIVKTVTAQVMGHLVKTEVITDGALSAFSTIYEELQDIVFKVLLSSSYNLLAFIEVQAALDTWKAARPTTTPENPTRLSAAEIMFLAQLRAEAEDAEIIPPSWEASEMEDDDADMSESGVA